MNVVALGCCTQLATTGKCLRQGATCAREFVGVSTANASRLVPHSAAHLTLVDVTRSKCFLHLVSPFDRRVDHVSVNIFRHRRPTRRTCRHVSHLVEARHRGPWHSSKLILGNTSPTLVFWSWCCHGRVHLSLQGEPPLVSECWSRWKYANELACRGLFSHSGNLKRARNNVYEA